MLPVLEGALVPTFQNVAEQDSLMLMDLADLHSGTFSKYPRTLLPELSRDFI
jgi:hypothetical protein